MTGPTPHLQVNPAQGEASAVALVLHGGRARSTGAVRANQLAVLRMTPFATSLHQTGAAHGLAVARLRYLVRGWNGSLQSPVADVRWALDQLAEQHPGAPVALIGHSMGGRAAMYAAGHRSVSTVVGLAPWIEPGDPFAQLAGRRVLIVHGDRDRMTSAPASAEYARDAARVAASLSYVSVRSGRHAMLRRARLWHELTTGYVLGVMCGVSPTETVGAESANILLKALSGQTSLTA